MITPPILLFLDNVLFRRLASISWCRAYCLLKTVKQALVRASQMSQKRSGIAGTFERASRSHICETRPRNPPVIFRDTHSRPRRSRTEAEEGTGKHTHEHTFTIHDATMIDEMGARLSRDRHQQRKLRRRHGQEKQ